MNNNFSLKPFSCLSDFIDQADVFYQEQIIKISLFNKDKTKHWSLLQKQQFAKIFYHLRGHFHDFLWLMGNFSPSIEEKNILLKNIAEEFGEERQSHEKLYFLFAKALQVDMQEEIITEENYVDFARKFNKGHIQWLLEHGWNEKQAAFSAYEHLDNIDYPYLLDLAISFDVPDAALVFFKVHTKVEHYSATKPLLEKIWKDEPQSIINGFNFIYHHQLEMWRNLYKAVNNLGIYNKETELLT